MPRPCRGSDFKGVGITAGKQKPLSKLQLRAAAMIAAGRYQTDIARELKITNVIISKWKKERPDFLQAIEDEFGGLLQDARNKAMEVLMTQMSDSNKWVAQNAAGRVLAQYNSIYAREQSGNVTFVFGNVPATPGMPIPSNMDLVLPEASENPD